MTPGFQRTGLFVVATVVVLLAGAAGAFLGLFATVLYTGFGTQPGARSISAELGGWLGGGSGVGVGVLWSAVMLERSAEWAARTARRARGVVGAGTLFGLFAGIASSLMLHVGLQMAGGAFQLDGILVGLGFGVPAGLLVGVIAGLLWLAALPKPQRPET